MQSKDRLNRHPRLISISVWHMTLDSEALSSAEQTLHHILNSEAEQQQAYIFRFPDGHVSLELEWLDIRSITRTIVAAYVAHLDRHGSNK